MSDKIFCGNGREIQTKYGTMMKLSFSASDLEKLQQHLENGWVNAVVSEKREKVEGKPSHYLTIDTWKPENGTGSASNQNSASVDPFNADGSELPF